MFAAIEHVERRTIERRWRRSAVGLLESREAANRRRALARFLCHRETLPTYPFPMVMALQRRKRISHSYRFSRHGLDRSATRVLRDAAESVWAVSRRDYGLVPIRREGHP